MVFIGIPLACALLLFCCLSSSESRERKCNFCNDEATCKRPGAVTCDVVEAMKTSEHLNKYRENVDTTVTNDSFTCFADVIQTKTGNRLQYMGCIFVNIDGCSKPLRSTVDSLYAICSQKLVWTAPSSWVHSPAGRITASVITVLVAIALVSIASKVFGRCSLLLLSL